MKKAALVAAALAMVLSLAACGNKDNNTPDNQTGGNSAVQNGGTGSNSGAGVNGGANDNAPGGTGAGTGNDSGAGLGTGTGSGIGTDTGIGNGVGTGTDTGVGTGTGTDTGAGTDTGTGTDAGTGRSRMGNDLRRAADSVGNAVTGMADEGRAAARGASATTFQRMLDNARVHDVDGVLTDGENSRW